MIKNKKYNIVSGNGDINFFVITKITLDKLKRMFLERLKHNKQSYRILDDNISFSKQPEKRRKRYILK